MAEVENARASRLGQFGSICGSSPAPAPLAEAAPATLPATTIGQGTFVVGREVQPGTYRTEGPDQDSLVSICTWQRLKNTSGEVGSWIASGIEKGPAVVTIKSSDAAFKSQGCQTWTKVD
jgi:hypothetical protein